MNRDFVNNIPDKVLYDQSLTLADIRIYAIIRSFMDTTGEAYPSNNWIASKLKIERRSVIRCITKLLGKGFLSKSETNGKRYLSITVAKFEAQLVTSVSPPSDLNVTPPSDLNVTQLDQSIIIPKEINTLVRSDERTFSSVSSKSSKNITIQNYRQHTLFPQYMRFYEHYPRKQQPFDGFRAFINLKPTNELVEILINDIKKRRKNDNQWQDKRYIPLPASYLREELWLDEIVEKECPRIYPTAQERAKNQQMIKAREDIASKQKRAEMDRLREFKELITNKLTEEQRNYGIQSIKAIKEILQTG